MNALDWTQIALFGAGVVVHFLYTRLAPSSSGASTPPAGTTPPTAAPTLQLPNATETAQVLAAIAQAVIAQQSSAPSAQTPALSSTESGLLALLHKLVDQQGQATSAPAQTPTTGSH